ncbi:hypothetical protein SPFL3102_01328 [Sporomusaceae bacterium FL31]|nr:hypothetical protein SPFL3101_00063 [Sporomusaceae bacterium FL31]GCE33521.1 hypothetical protein SPFL3102_01328 [Sporomusaceae bacterium]
MITIISPFLTKQAKTKITFKLMMIVVFLVIIGVGNVVGIYDAFIKNDISAMALSGAASIFYFIPAYGLFHLKVWARNLELALSIIVILLGILVLLFESVVAGIAITIPHGLICLYLLSRECKEIFSSSDT